MNLNGRQITARFIYYFIKKYIITKNNKNEFSDLGFALLGAMLFCKSLQQWSLIRVSVILVYVIRLTVRTWGYSNDKCFMLITLPFLLRISSHTKYANFFNAKAL